MNTNALSDVIRGEGARWDEQVDGAPAPRDYGDCPAEYAAATQRAALHYVGHWGRLLLGGADHIDFLHRMTTNHFTQLQNGCGLQAVFTENRGRIVDVGSFYRREQHTLAIVSPAARHTIPAWLDRFIFAEDITIVDIGESTSMFDIIGPDAMKAARQILDLPGVTYAPHQLVDCPSHPDLWIAALAGPAAGLRLLGEPQQLAALWRTLRAAGAHPIGEQAWNARRIELGIPLAGGELNDEHNPWEAGLGEAIHMNKGCYIGQEVIARLDTYDKIKQHLVGIAVSTAAPPPPGTQLLSANAVVGTVTSSALSPTLGPIALAYVRRSHAAPGTQLALAEDRGTGTVQSLPF